GRVAHLVDLFVARAVLFDVGVAPCDVRLRLVVVVVRDEVLDGVLREELLELAVKLSCERLVVREDERRAPRFSDDLRHRHGLPRPRYATQRRMPLPALERGEQARRRSRLVSSETPRQYQPERRLCRRSIERNLKGAVLGHACLILEQTFWYHRAPRT